MKVSSYGLVARFAIMLSVRSVATLESSAMPFTALNAVFIGTRSCFYDMACVLKERRHSLTHGRSTFKTIAG